MNLCAKCGQPMTGTTHACPAMYTAATARISTGGRPPLGEQVCTVCGDVLPTHALCERVRRLEQQVADLRMKKTPR